MATMAAALSSIMPSSGGLALAHHQSSADFCTRSAVPSRVQLLPPCRVRRENAFLGESITHAVVSTSNAESVSAGGTVRCFTESDLGRGGRVIFTPFGPFFTPNYGRGNAGREWERRNQGQDERVRAQRERLQAQQERYRVQQERIREMIETERKRMMERRRSARGNAYTQQNQDMELLRELERRLKAQDTVRGGGANQSTDELMKELERRLRSKDGKGEEVKEERSGGQETGTVYDSLYAWMREWDKGVREERERLQKQWEERGKTERPQKSSDSPSKSENKDELKSRAERENVFDLREFEQMEEEERRRNANEENRSSSQAGDGFAKEMKHKQSDGTVVYLKNEANGAEIYLVGTSHVSQKSADEVREVIKKVKPDFVMVELDRKRYDSMIKGQAAGGRDNPLAFFQQMVQTIANGNIGAVGKLVGVGLSGFYRLLATRGLQPGQEFKVAIEEGKNVGAKIVLGDQDIDITMKHLGEQMSMQDAFKFFGQPMPSDIAQQMSGQAPTADMFERLRDRKIVRRFSEEMEKGAPALTKVLLGERNEAMTKALRNLKGKVVAVVGLAHLDGMEQLWHEANDNFLTGIRS